METLVFNTKYIQYTSMTKCKKCNTPIEFIQMVDRVVKRCFCDIDSSGMEAIYANRGYFQ